MDQVSILARETMRMGKIQSNDPELTPIFQVFQDWDGHLFPVSPQPAIYEVFTRYLIVKLTAPRLGDLAPLSPARVPRPSWQRAASLGSIPRNGCLPRSRTRLALVEYRRRAPRSDLIQRGHA